MSFLSKDNLSVTFILVLIVMFLNSCVMYYNTNEIRNNLKKSINQINNIATKAYSDHKTKIKMYKDLSVFIIDKNLEPFKSISHHMKVFDNIYITVDNKKKEVIALQKRFEKVTNGKNKINSNQPEWDEIKNIKKQMSQKGDEMNILIKKYSNSSNQIGKKIENSGLKPMDKNEFINQIEKNQQSLKASIKEIFKNIELYRFKAENAHNSNFINDSVYNFKLIILNDMNNVIDMVKKADKMLLFHKEKFIKKTKNKQTIWIGENTYANGVLNDIKKQIAIIKLAKNKFNNLSIKLNQ